MAAYRWGILIIAIVLVAILYSLPRVVVENDVIPDQALQDEVEESHNFEVNTSDRRILKSLQKKISESTDNKKSAIFADSLAKIYLSYNKLDSAALYIDLIPGYDQSLESYIRVGDLYFQLQGVSLDQDEAKFFAEKAGNYFEQVLAEGEDPDIRAKLAMTKVVTSNPMEGVMMLRSVLEEYPENATALYSMGIMSMQSGQYEKAVGRFEKLITIDSSNMQATYYLAVSYYESGQYGEAKEWFKKLKVESTDPAILESTDKYLKILNEL